MKTIKQMTFTFIILFNYILLIISQSDYVMSAPTNVSNITAGGGNTTPLNLDSSRETAYWQGFFGSVSGGIVLEDTDGSNFYDWEMVSATGEIYATRYNIADWNTINCSNISHIYDEEDRLNIISGEGDDINRTFNSTAHPVFQVASRNMVNCRSTLTANSTGQLDVFWNVLLNANGTTTVYTALMDDNTIGYNNSAIDFQLLVPVNATKGFSIYQIYVELG